MGSSSRVAIRKRAQVVFFVFVLLFSVLFFMLLFVVMLVVFERTGWDVIVVQI